MKQLLIISPTFLPKTSADMHRVRMMARHLEHHGWKATVLSASPEEVPGPTDPLLTATLSEAVRVIHYHPLRLKIWGKLGVRNLGWRSLRPLKRRGNELLKTEKFDCVLFSTTMFITWKAGPYWKKRHGVPYVLDFQDPWWRFQKRTHPAPGSPLKAFIARLSARCFEPKVVSQSCGIITVSPDYKAQLETRYPLFPASRIAHIPFSGSTDDFELLKTVAIPNKFFNPEEPLHHLVYVGRLGEDMVPALNALFRCFVAYLERHPEQAKNFRFHFIGTSYAHQGKIKLSAIPIAANWNVLDYVIETPERRPYLEALKAIVESNGVLVLGSTDSAYSPSKLFPALLSEKPILCIAAKDSLLSQFVNEYRVPAILWDYTYSKTNEMLFEKFRELPSTAVSELPSELLTLTLAQNMTERVCNFLDACVEK